MSSEKVFYNNLKTRFHPKAEEGANFIDYTLKDNKCDHSKCYPSFYVIRLTKSKITILSIKDSANVIIWH
jgi:hypothetical protein